MMDKVLIIGGNRIQYYMAKSLAERGFAIFYYGAMPYEKPRGVRLVKDVDMLSRLLADQNCLVVLPLKVHVGGEENARESSIVPFIEELQFVGNLQSIGKSQFVGNLQSIGESQFVGNSQSNEESQFVGYSQPIGEPKRIREILTGEYCHGQNEVKYHKFSSMAGNEIWKTSAGKETWKTSAGKETWKTMAGNEIWKTSVGDGRQKLRCKLWQPTASLDVKMKLAQLLSEAAIVEGKLLLGKAISQTRALVIGFGVYAEQIAKRLREWECDVVVMPDDTMEYQLASYRKYTVCAKNNLEAVQGEAGKRVELVYQCSERQPLTGKEMSLFPDNAVILNITDREHAVDMKYAAKNHMCVKHANHLLLEYAPLETGKILGTLLLA